MVEAVGWLLATVVGLPIAFFLIGEIEHGIRYLKEIIFSEAVVCKCITPKDSGPLGSTFVCGTCGRAWYSTHDNVAWAGWDWAPWWKRAQMKLGWEKPGMRREADPLPVEKKLNALEIKALEILKEYKARFK